MSKQNGLRTLSPRSQYSLLISFKPITIDDGLAELYHLHTQIKLERYREFL